MIFQFLELTILAKINNAQMDDFEKFVCTWRFGICLQKAK